MFRIYKLKKSMNLTRRLRLLNQTGVVNVMEDMMKLINIWTFCQILIRMWYCCSLCHGWYSWAKLSSWKAISTSHYYDKKYDEQKYSPKWLWGEALRTINSFSIEFLLNLFIKHLTELWIGKKPSVSHFHILGCLVEVRIYNPELKKIDRRAMSCFIGYQVRSKGYKFYYTTRALELSNILM